LLGDVICYNIKNFQILKNSTVTSDMIKLFHIFILNPKYLNAFLGISVSIYMNLWQLKTCRLP